MAVPETDPEKTVSDKITRWNRVGESGENIELGDPLSLLTGQDQARGRRNSEQYFCLIPAC